MWEPDTATSTKPSNKDSPGLEIVCYTQCFCILQWNDGIPVFYHKEVSAEHCFCTTLRGVLCFTMHFQMEVRVINACAVSQVFDILESFCISAPLTHAAVRPAEVLSSSIPTAGT